MTTHARPINAASGAAWRPRSDVQIALQQVEGIERFNRVRRRLEVAGAVRRRQVLRREHDAVVRRAQQQLEDSGAPLQAGIRRTVLLAHRDAEFMDHLGASLAAQGVDVSACLSDGAEALGAAVAEQPDLLLVEDALATVPAEDVVPRVLGFCPSTRVVAQVACPERMGTLLEAGASGVFTSHVAPDDVAAEMSRLLTQ